MASSPLNMKIPENPRLIARAIGLYESDILPYPDSIWPDKGGASPGTYISLDCEYVQVYGVHNDVYYDVARLSIVNYNGDVVLDTFVKPRRPVSKYMTHISGITSKDLVNAPKFAAVRSCVRALLSDWDRILVGHALKGDLKALGIWHSADQIRDTSTYLPLVMLGPSETPSLKSLTGKVLGVTIQKGAHSSVIDARAAMGLYRACQHAWR